MSDRRRRKVASIIRQEVSTIIQQEMKDPRLGFVSVTRVDLSPDIKYARIFVSVYGSTEDQQKAMEALEHAKGFIRRSLAPRLSLRSIPVLQFQLDQNMEYAENINRLLDALAQEELEHSDNRGSA